MMPHLPPDLPWASLALLMLAKPAAVVLAALLVVRLLPPRRAAAAARHLVWTLAVGALLLLPAAAVLLPRWEAGWIPAAASPAAPASIPRPAPADAAASTSADPVDAPFGSLDGGAVESPAEHPSSLPPLPGTAAGVYLAGLLAVLGWAMAGFVSVRRIARRAAAVTDAAWLGLLRDVAWELDVDRPIRLLQSASWPMPMTWGVRHPAILLPAAAEGWSEEQRRAVLRHEVAHVARRDCLTQAAAAAACVLYWFHPAAWYAARQLRVERELACDDRVLGAGTGARAYAGHLLEVARSFRAPRLVTPATVSMARPSQLEGRMLAVLDSERRRRPLPRSVARGAVLAALAAVLPLAALAPAQRGDAAPPVEIAAADTAAADPGIPPLPEGPPVEAIVQAAFGETLELRLAAKSEVRITGWDRDAVQARSWGSAEGDAEGRITLERTAGGARIDGAAPHVEIRVPRRYGLELRGAGSRVELRDVAGRFAGSTEGGDLVMMGIGGDVGLTTAGGRASIVASRLRGRVWTAGGGASVGSTSGDLEVDAGAGAVMVEARTPSGEPAVRRFIGAVRVLAETAFVALDQRNGAVLVADAREGLDVRTGRGSVEIGGTGGHARIRTGAGAITLLRASGSADVATGAGDVYLQLLNTRDASIETGGGGVTLELPSDFRGVIDVTLTSSGGGGTGRIRSDVPLSHVPAGPGVVRRTGTVPGGEAARVSIRATGGDVTIRRAPPPP